MRFFFSTVPYMCGYGIVKYIKTYDILVGGAT